MASTASLPAWEVKADQKRNSILAAIPSEWRLSQQTLDEARTKDNLVGFLEDLLDSETRSVTNLDCEEILTRISNNQLTAVQAITAACKRTAFAHQMSHCVLEYCYASAVDQAQGLDAFFARNGCTIGPLHGLPVSLKDQFHIKGYDTSMGYVGWIGSQGNEPGTREERFLESELIRQLRSLGAVVVAKTSPAQTLWCAETNNNILGYCYNPLKQCLSSGGSSGGQAALLALRGTTIGFGTDVGGSVSIPAAFHGLCSIKPSHGRISFRNAAMSTPGQNVIPTVVGILATSLGGLRAVFRALQSARAWATDPDLLRIPFCLHIRHQNVAWRIGVMPSDNIVTPHPPVQRAIQIVKSAVEKQGHTVSVDCVPGTVGRVLMIKTVLWDPPSHEEASLLHAALTGADGNTDVFKQLSLSAEPLIPELRHEFGERPRQPMPIPEFYENCQRLKVYREQYHDYWESMIDRVDAVVLPAAPHAGVLPGQWYYYGYGLLANVLDYATVIIPVTHADARVDGVDQDYRPLNELDRRNWAAYDPEAYDGAPVCVQILGRRLDEEMLLSVARMVVECLACDRIEL